VGLGGLYEEHLGLVGGERKKNRKWKKKLEVWETPFFPFFCWSDRGKGVLTRFLLVPLGSSPFFTRTHPPQLFDGTVHHRLIPPVVPMNRHPFDYFLNFHFVFLLGGLVAMVTGTLEWWLL
jgi:hypothetical protein